MTKSQAITFYLKLNEECDCKPMRFQSRQCYPAQHLRNRNQIVTKNFISYHIQVDLDTDRKTPKLGVNLKRWAVPPKGVESPHAKTFASAKCR